VNRCQQSFPNFLTFFAIFHIFLFTQNVRLTGSVWFSHESVSVFQVGRLSVFGFLYVFFKKVGSVFGVGFREYRDIGIGFSDFFVS
jgi:hypothetical protein